MPFQKGHHGYNTSESIEKSSQRMTLLWKNKEFKEKMRKKLIGHKGHHRKGINAGEKNSSKRPEVRKKLSESMILQFKEGKRKNPLSNPEIVKKIIEKRNKNKKWLEHIHTLSKKTFSGKHRLDLTGEKNVNWKGGVTNDNEKIRTSLEFKIWRREVFKRDNYTCQNKNCKYCDNKKGVTINAHHIKEFSKYPELRFAIDNGITYCRKYHMIMHNIEKKAM